MDFTDAFFSNQVKLNLLVFGKLDYCDCWLLVSKLISVNHRSQWNFLLLQHHHLHWILNMSRRDLCLLVDASVFQLKLDDALLAHGVTIAVRVKSKLVDVRRVQWNKA